MKVKCEYCQNMVEVQPGVDKVCPFCGSPLPAAPEPPRNTAREQMPRQPKAASNARVLVSLLVFFILLGAAGGILYLNSQPKRASGDPDSLSIPNMKVTDALDAVNEGTIDAGAYMVVINYYLEGSRADTAYQAAKDLLELPDSPEYMAWCVQEFVKFDRPDLAARLAMAADVRFGNQELYPLVRDTTLDQLLPDSPLCQAMELVLGRTASAITLADLQGVTGVSIGRKDSLTGAQEIGLAFDEDGQDFVTVTVEYTGAGSGLGTICFQGLRTFILNDSNIRTKDDLNLPGLRELDIVLRMDAENLVKFTHLKNLERLELGGPSLVSLEGLEDLPALTELVLFDTGLTDLSALAAKTGITSLTLRDSDQLTSVASLSQAGHLRSLTLSGKSLTDLSPLSSLSGLENLSVTGTAIRSASFLSGMTGLKELELTGNKDLETVPELAELTSLERLTLDSDGLIASQDDLQALTSLRALKLRISKDLRFLSPLADRLEELTIYSYQATWDVSGVSQFRNLKKFSLSSGSDFYDSYTAQLEGLSGLRDLPLEELNVSGKPIYGDINAILDIPTLQVLNLSGTHSEGTDYARFANLTQLRELNLSGYRDMVDTPPGEYEEYWSYKAGPASVFVDQLDKLTGLEKLDLSGCGAEDVSSLQGLAGLTWLDLSGNDISDLSPLAGLDNLTYLKLTGNRVGDYSPVEGRAGLTLIR
ncbi:MAG: leucine-rich repeat domain-containing protein [Oscillospiraceae bacterium]|nr:leucine-rich repeat domain-containing protein [Oscillospiraceae bacterium]